MFRVKEDGVGVSSLILGIVGYCICWLPGVGWLGVAMGVVACGLGIPSLTHWFARSGYTAWGVSGTILGAGTISLGLAYQAKHAGGALDYLLYPLATPTAYLLIGALIGVAVFGVVLSRLKTRMPGAVVALVAVAGVALSGAWALSTADREFESVAPKTARAE
jgi:hypothetical protein